jgi:hypothetical protein
LQFFPLRDHVPIRKNQPLYCLAVPHGSVQPWFETGGDA